MTINTLEILYHEYKKYLNNTFKKEDVNNDILTHFNKAYLLDYIKTFHYDKYDKKKIREFVKLLNN